MGNFFDESEYQEIEEESAAEKVLARLQAKPEVASEEEEDELADVDARLETADHYRAILNHQFFDADSAASRVVDREIRAFIKERLEILLGIRSPRAADVAQFTEEEAEALKTLADPDVTRALGAVAKKVLGKTGPAIIESTPKPLLKKVPAPVKTSVKAVVSAKPEVKKVPAPPAKAKVATPKKAEAKPPANATQQTYVNHDGQNVTLIEGEILNEDGRRYRVVKNEHGTLYKRDITGQVVSAGYRPPTKEQVEIESRIAAEQHISSFGESAGLALFGSLK